MAQALWKLDLVANNRAREYEQLLAREEALAARVTRSVENTVQVLRRMGWTVTPPSQTP